MELLLPCPNCGWQNLLRKEAKYEGEGETHRVYCTGARCLKCGWEGEFLFHLNIISKREGDPQ